MSYERGLVAPFGDSTRVRLRLALVWCPLVSLYEI